MDSDALVENPPLRGRPKYVVHTLHSLGIWFSIEILILFLQTTPQRVLFSEQ